MSLPKILVIGPSTLSGCCNPPVSMLLERMKKGDKRKSEVYLDWN